MSKVKKALESKLAITVFSILVSFVVGAFFLAIMGISPIEAYAKLFSSIFSTPKNMAYCVVYGTPLIFTGLAVAFSFRTGVFNIGAEGQFVVGSMAACVVGILVPAPSIILIPLCFIAAAVAGGQAGELGGPGRGVYPRGDGPPVRRGAAAPAHAHGSGGLRRL